MNEAPTVTSKDGRLENHIVNTSTAYNPVANATVGAYLYSNDSAGVAKPASNLLNGVDASNMTLSAATPVSVTFQKEAAGNHNMVGTYQYDNSGNVIAGSVKFVWLDASAGTEGKLGASMVEGLPGLLPGQHRLARHHAGRNPCRLLHDLERRQRQRQQDAADQRGGRHRQPDGGDERDRQPAVDQGRRQRQRQGLSSATAQMNGDVFFTHNKTLNTDFNGSGDIDHMASGVSSNLPGQLLIGVEDLSGGGDKDFNDVVFSVDLGTYNVNKMTQSSLQPTVDFSDVDSDTLSQAVIHTSGFQAGDALNVPPSGDFNVTVNQSARRLHHHHRRQDRHRDARPVRGLRQLDLLLDQQQDRRRAPHRLHA